MEKCKSLNRAMRIGTNHGSLSARILSYYGGRGRMLLGAGGWGLRALPQPLVAASLLGHCLLSTRCCRSSPAGCTALLTRPSRRRAPPAGDTPRGMVESAFEFADICRDNDYHNFVFSMKVGGCGAGC